MITINSLRPFFSFVSKTSEFYLVLSLILFLDIFIYFYTGGNNILNTHLSFSTNISFKSTILLIISFGFYNTWFLLICQGIIAEVILKTYPSVWIPKILGEKNDACQISSDQLNAFALYADNALADKYRLNSEREAENAQKFTVRALSVLILLIVDATISPHSLTRVIYSYLINHVPFLLLMILALFIALFLLSLINIGILLNFHESSSTSCVYLPNAEVANYIKGFVKEKNEQYRIKKNNNTIPKK